MFINFVAVVDESHIRWTHQNERNDDSKTSRIPDHYLYNELKTSRIPDHHLDIELKTKRVPDNYHDDGLKTNRIPENNYNNELKTTRVPDNYLDFPTSKRKNSSGRDVIKQSEDESGLRSSKSNNDKYYEEKNYQNSTKVSSQKENPSKQGVHLVIYEGIGPTDAATGVPIATRNVRGNDEFYFIHFSNFLLCVFLLPLSFILS